jgi:hypothetical protein
MMKVVSEDIECLSYTASEVNGRGKVSEMLEAI